MFLPVTSRLPKSRTYASTDISFVQAYEHGGEACLPSNAYHPRTPDYTIYYGVHVCWSEHFDSSFVYGFMNLDYGLGTMTASTLRAHLVCPTYCISQLPSLQVRTYIISSDFQSKSEFFTAENCL